MKTCIAIRHIHFEDLGSFAAPVTAAGYTIRYLEAGIDNLDAAKEADLVTFLGGPIGVYEEQQYPFLKDEFNIAEYRLKQERPTLGLCLGSQILARAGGAKVYAGDMGKEIGWKTLQLTEAGKNSIIAPLGENGGHMFHWHGDTFDLPDGATLLASTDCYAHQIYTIGQNILAFQCHPELDPQKIEHWLTGHACEIAASGMTTPVSLRHDTALYGKDLTLRGQRVMAQWLNNLGR